MENNMLNSNNHQREVTIGKSTPLSSGSNDNNNNQSPRLEQQIKEESEESTSPRLSSPSLTSGVFRRLNTEPPEQREHSFLKHETQDADVETSGGGERSSERTTLETRYCYPADQPMTRGEMAYAYYPSYHSHPPPPNHYYAADRYHHPPALPPPPPVHHHYHHPSYYQGAPVYSAATHSSSSFESHASSAAAAAPTVVQSNASASIVTYASSSYGPPPTQQSPSSRFTGYPYYHQHPPPWTTTPPPPVEHHVVVLKISKNDVLCGRGGATNSHTGNRAFRNLVKQYQDRYLCAKKRDKPAVASIIVDIIRKNGGRFVRRSEKSPQGKTLWVEIGVKKAVEKTCQALRENAPEIRRKTKAGSSDDDESRDSPKAGAHSSRSSMTRKATAEHTPMRRVKQKTLLGNESLGESQKRRGDEMSESPIFIRPVAKLMPKKKADAIALDDLTEHERNLYLQDFLPPHPTRLRNAKPESSNFLASHGYGTSGNDNNDSSSPWPVVRV